MPVTLRDVAKLADVSTMTVSRVVNGKPGVQEETRLRVQSAVSELGYVPNSQARALIQQKTGTIGLVVPDIVDPFFTLILRGAEDVGRRTGYRFILCETVGDLQLERDYLEDLIFRRVDGLIIAPVSDDSRRNLSMLSRHKLPYVLIDRSVPEVEADTVRGDSINGSRSLVELLVGLGHRNIGHVTESGAVSTARDRLQGYRDALQAAGIRYDAELVAFCDSASAAGGYAATQMLVAERPDLTAIFAVNNLSAVGVVKAVRDAGLSIPGDIAVVCFDDIELAAWLYPFLTVMAQPAETFGTIATQLLLDRIDGRLVDRPRLVVLPPQLIVRESSGGSIEAKSRSWTSRSHSPGGHDDDSFGQGAAPIEDVE